MAHAQKPDFLFPWNGRDHLNWLGHQFSRLLAAEVRASAVVILDTPCSEVVWRVLATHFIRQFPIHFPSRASPWAITFQLESTTRPLAHTILMPADDWAVHQICYSIPRISNHHTVTHACQQYTNPGFQVVRASKYCVVVPNIGRFLAWNLPQVSPITPRTHGGSYSYRKFAKLCSVPQQPNI